MTFSCLLFDLDGTLIDSRADLVTAVNLVLEQLGHAPLADDRVVSFVGEGARKLVERALQARVQRPPSPTEVDEASRIFSNYYGLHLLDRTRAYPEVRETLFELRHLSKAVVTNKPYDFTVRILEGLDLIHHFKGVLGGDSLPERKPSGVPLLEAARRCEARPEHCLMIGDSRIDVLAGKAADIRTCGYVAGFRGRVELEDAGADYLIESFGDLLSIVER